MRLSRKKKKFLQNRGRRGLKVVPMFKPKFDWVCWWAHAQKALRTLNQLLGD